MLFLVILGCSLDNVLVDVEDEPEHELDGTTPTESGQGSPADTGSSTDDDDPDPDPADTGDDPDESLPRAPERGELVLTELMINPEAVSDGDGEWIEILNASDDWISLAGLWLADDNVDLASIEGDVVVAPDSYAVICANSNSAQNGGVRCDGTFFYQTWGEGFALANTADEVILLDDWGTELDSVVYGDGFSALGASVGLAPQFGTTASNDDTGHWCRQDTRLSGGDDGTPGGDNDPC